MPPGRARSGWSFPLRAHLLVLVVGTLLPALVLAAVLIQRVVNERRDAVRQQLLEASRAEASVLDSELTGTIRALRVLAESDRLTIGDTAGFRERAERIQMTEPSWEDVVLETPDAVGVVNTGKSSGGIVPSALDRDSLKQLVSTRLPVIGNLRGGSDFGEPFSFAVHVPVLRAGRLIYILSAVITPDRLAKVIGQQTLSEEWVRGIVDKNGVLVARTRDPEQFVGQKGTPEFLKRYTAANEAVFRDTSLEGEAVYGAFTRAPVSGWIAGVAVPVSEVNAPFRRSMLALAGLGLVLLGVGLAGAFEISRRISRDIARAARSADAIARGMQPEVRQSPVTEVQQLSDALVRSAALLDERQHERDQEVARADAAREEAETARLEAETARMEAEAADAAKDEFLAMLGHELRNPLAPVLTALELMRLRSDSASTRERDIIERQVKHLVRLVDDIFDVSRLRRGRVELRRGPLEIMRAVEKAVEIAGPLIADRHHRLTIDVSVSGLVVDGDETRLAQVVANLLTNAAKYADRPGQIVLRGRSEGGMVVLTCEDDGIGISPELLPRVFDLFTQGVQSLDRRKGGLGLGLAVAKTLIELHGGTIEAASKGPGHGSTFTIRLPHVVAAVDQRAVSRVGAPTQRRYCRVLVVDDNRDAAAMLADTLRLGGCEVAMAFDGVEALNVAERFRADVAILDIGLPAMDGHELARRLREVDATGAIRLIALTGYGQPADFAASTTAGFDLHLVKPVTADVLFAAIHP